MHINPIMHDLNLTNHLKIATTILVAIILALILSHSRSSPTSFSTSIQTEIVKVSTEDLHLQAWFLPIEKIITDGEILSIKKLTIFIEKNSVIQFHKVGRDQTRISITSQSNTAIATLYNDKDELVRTVNQSLHAILSTDYGIINLPIAGRITLGESIPEQTTSTSPALLNGNIQVLRSALFNSNRFTAKNIPLQLGDRITFTGVGYGLLRIDPQENGIKVAFHTDASSAEIARFGTTGFSVKPTLWELIVADPEVQFTFAICVVFFPLAISGIKKIFKLIPNAAYKRSN